MTNGSSSVTWVSGTPFNASGAWNGQKLFINGTAVTCATCTSTTALTLSAVWGGSTGTFGYSGLGPGFAVLLDQVPSLRTVDGLTSTPNSGPTTVGVEVLGFPGWNSAIRIENIHNEGKSPWMLGRNAFDFLNCFLGNFAGLYCATVQPPVAGTRLVSTQYKTMRSQGHWYRCQVQAKCGRAEFSDPNVPEQDCVGKQSCYVCRATDDATEAEDDIVITYH